MQNGIPGRWEVGPYFAHHLASCTPLHPFVTLHFEMLLFHPPANLDSVHTSRSADEAEKKGIPSVALQVPLLTTWELTITVI